MNYQNIPQENKTEILEQAVINETPEQLAETFRELGYVEMTARALGLACRFGGVEYVKALTESGASFDIPKSESAERTYHCYSGMKYRNYRSDFSLYLLNITKQIKGACCCKGLKPVKQAARKDKTYAKQLPDGERAEVLKYLCENAEKLSFKPSEMLYYAIFARDEFIAAELKKRGITLLETRANSITNGAPIMDSYWYEWLSMIGKLSDEDYLPVMRRLAREVGGKTFHCTGKVYEVTKKHFVNVDILEFFRDNFKTEKLNKTQVIRDLIDNNAASSLPVAEKLGWLDNPKRRDEMIEYAQQNERVECLAFLLDFKNRTADFAAERARAEKKMMRELNASPTSVTAMKQIWSFKKGNDGALIITSYKGTSAEVSVPEKIGKSIVTAIGRGAFAGGCGLCGGRVATYATFEQQEHRRKITKVTLPNSVKVIGNSAFAAMTALSEINIPNGAAEIGDVAFYQCIKLEKLVIPDTVTFIGEYAFERCDMLTVIVTRGSYAEKYCKKNGIAYKYKEET